MTWVVQTRLFRNWLFTLKKGLDVIFAIKNERGITGKGMVGGLLSLDHFLSSGYYLLRC